MDPRSPKQPYDAGGWHYFNPPKTTRRLSCTQYGSHPIRISAQTNSLPSPLTLLPRRAVGRFELMRDLNERLIAEIHRWIRPASLNLP
jgi:hypothetical protein